MGLSAVFPVLHAISLYGMQQMRQSIGLFWLVLQGILYISGAGIYSVRRTILNHGGNIYGIDETDGDPDAHPRAAKAWKI